MDIVLIRDRKKMDLVIEEWSEGGVVMFAVWSLLDLLLICGYVNLDP